MPGAHDMTILRILDADMTDAGDYSVLAVNKYGEARANCSVLVLPQTDTPMPAFLKGLSQLSLLENDLLRLEVQLSDPAGVRVQWSVPET